MKKYDDIVVDPEIDIDDIPDDIPDDAFDGSGITDEELRRIEEAEAGLMDEDDFDVDDYGYLGGFSADDDYDEWN